MPRPNKTQEQLSRNSGFGRVLLGAFLLRKYPLSCRDQSEIAACAKNRYYVLLAHTLFVKPFCLRSWSRVAWYFPCHFKHFLCSIQGYCFVWHLESRIERCLSRLYLFQQTVDFLHVLDSRVPCANSSLMAYHATGSFGSKTKEIVTRFTLDCLVFYFKRSSHRGLFCQSSEAPAPLTTTERRRDMPIQTTDRNNAAVT